MDECQCGVQDEWMLMRDAGWMDVDAGRKMGGCRCGVQDARGVADAPPRKIRKFRIYVKFDEIDQENSGPTIQFSPKIGF